MTFDIVPLIPGWMVHLFWIAGLLLVILSAIGVFVDEDNPNDDGDLETWDNGLAEVVEP